MRPQNILTAVAIVLLVIIVGANQCNKPPEPGEPVRGLSNEEREQFESGLAVFKRTFVTGNGLGPVFNSTSCAECHESPIPGGVGDEVEQHIGRVGPSGVCDPLLELGGPVLQAKGTPLAVAHGISGESADLGMTVAHRITPLVFGMGLLDAVPDAELRRLADPDDADGDGVSGRPAVLADGSIGRFGRKAAVAHLQDFVEMALLQEQGITSPNLPHELLPNGKPIPDGVDPTPDPEVDIKTVGDLTSFMMFLAPIHAKQDGGHGEYVFASIGCAKCHVPELKWKRGKISAYTDLLLHDMGPELADICEGVASPAEWRTHPLMGLRLETKFMHDGRAKTVTDAIEAHGGEGSGARNAFESLSVDEKKELLKFLGRL